jgi:hypothetical protein
MNARSIAGVLLGVSIAACGSEPAAEPASPPVYPGTPGPELPPTSSYAVSSGSIDLTGRLDGELNGIELAGETSDNAGSFELWASGGGHTQLNIAATGNPSGAGMLIVSFMGSALGDLLDAGTWQSTVVDDTVVDTGQVDAGSTVVTSCAGPSMGNWPFELPATSAEITATEAPERPGSVVLVVKGQFPAAHLGAEATTELVGTFSFDRFE